MHGTGAARRAALGSTRSPDHRLVRRNHSMGPIVPAPGPAEVRLYRCAICRGSLSAPTNAQAERSGISRGSAPSIEIFTGTLRTQ